MKSMQTQANHLPWTLKSDLTTYCEHIPLILNLLPIIVLPRDLEIVMNQRSANSLLGLRACMIQSKFGSIYPYMAVDRTLRLCCIYWYIMLSLHVHSLAIKMILHCYDLISTWHSDEIHRKKRQKWNQCKHKQITCLEP